MGVNKILFGFVLSFFSAPSIAQSMDYLAIGLVERVYSDSRVDSGTAFILPKFCDDRVEYKAKDFGLTLVVKLVFDGWVESGCIHIDHEMEIKNQPYFVTKFDGKTMSNLLKNVQVNCPVFFSDWKHVADPKSYESEINAPAKILLDDSPCSKWTPFG